MQRLEQCACMTEKTEMHCSSFNVNDLLDCGLPLTVCIYYEEKINNI